MAVSRKSGASVEKSDRQHSGVFLMTLVLVACGSGGVADSTGEDMDSDSGADEPDAGVIEARLDAIIGELTLEEKVAQMAGTAGLPTRGLWLTPGIERFGLPGYRMTDGPRGLSANKPLYGAAGLLPTTCFPVGMARGATFDVELEERIGRAIGLEVRAWGGNVILAPVPAAFPAEETCCRSHSGISPRTIAYLTSM